MAEQLYVFVDKSGHCFEDFQTSSRTVPKDEIDEIVDKVANNKADDGEQRYQDWVGAMMIGGCEFSAGDMLTFRDDLEDAGYEWGKDFYVKKV